MNNTEEYVLWFLRGVSAGLVQITLTAAGLAALYGLVLFLTRPLRRRHRLDAGTPRTGGAFLAAGFWFLAVPVAMLVLGHLLARLNPEPVRTTFLRFWHPFWLVLIGLRFVEMVITMAGLAVNRRPPMPDLLRQSLWTAAVLVTGLACARYSLNADVTPILVSLIVLVGALGFGLQGLFGNLFAGMSIQITRAILPGDQVRVGELEGEIIGKNWRETRLRTDDGRFFAIPNTRVSEELLENFSRPNARRRHRVSFVAGFHDSPAAVEAALLDATRDQPELLRDEPCRPHVVMIGYLDHGVRYELRYWTDGLFHNRDMIDSAVQRRAWYQLRRHGVEIPLPLGGRLLQGVVDGLGGHGEKPQGIDRLAARRDALAGSRLGSLAAAGAAGAPSAALWDQIAAIVHDEAFDADEYVFHAGESARDLYVIARGRASVRLPRPDGGEHEVAMLGPGDLFGEMGLLLGLPRTASIVAVGELETLRLDEPGFNQLLQEPAAAAVLQELALSRWREDKALLERLPAAPAVQEGASRFPRLRQFRQALWSAAQALLKEER